MSATVVSVNVSPIQTVDYNGEPIATGIFKTPVDGRVAVTGVNLHGDDQADREAHGGPFQAVYAYATEDYDWWKAQLDRELPPGKFGENLTLSGIDVTNALIGERWRIGTLELAVTSPRVPCFKLAMTMGDPAFVKTFARALRPGAYLSISEEGDVAAGDGVEIVWKPQHTLTLQEFARIWLFERARLSELLVPELPSGWRDWVSSLIAKSGQ